MMIVANDEELIIYTGLAFSVPYDFKDDNDVPISFTSKTFTGILKNLHSDFTLDSAVTNFGTITTEPDGVVGRILIELNEAQTALIKIPDNELEPYTESGIYAKILVVDQDNLPVLDIKVRPIKAF